MLFFCYFEIILLLTEPDSVILIIIQVTILGYYRLIEMLSQRNFEGKCIKNVKFISDSNGKVSEIHHWFAIKLTTYVSSIVISEWLNSLVWV